MNSLLVGPYHPAFTATWDSPMIGTYGPLALSTEPLPTPCFLCWLLIPSCCHCCQAPFCHSVPGDVLLYQMMWAGLNAGGFRCHRVGTVCLNFIDAELVFLVVKENTSTEVERTLFPLVLKHLIWILNEYLSACLSFWFWWDRMQCNGDSCRKDPVLSVRVTHIDMFTLLKDIFFQLPSVDIYLGTRSVV